MQVRIIAVDDEPDILKIVEMSLAKWGYAVDTFTDPVAALDRFRQNPQWYSLILTDIKMPILDGIEASDRINQERAVPVILVSAYHEPKLIERAEQDHISGYLVKPVTAADLPPMIAIAMKRFGELQLLRAENAALRRQIVDADKPGNE